ncbi:MAG TPA: ribonuclease HII [Chlamydiales bacterium]|nr:ribonuclease HII [Chlamydiales bacterium]
MSLQPGSRIAGIDEVGRGALAGPVIAVCCILPILHAIEGITDSKKLSENQRERLYTQLTQHPKVEWGIGVVEADVIDEINILQATFLAMQRAVEALQKKPDHLLVDGNQLPPIPIPSSAIIGGDLTSESIGAASIIAKVTRDRLMKQLDLTWPIYRFAQNKGYGTKEHLEALKQWGPSPIHRKSFEPIRSRSLCFSA